MGDDNVIAGDVLGSQSNYYGNTTINRTVDDTKRIDTCHVCGGPRLVVEGYYCPGCGKFTCRDDYLPTVRRCTLCATAVQTTDGVSADDLVFSPGQLRPLFEYASAADRFFSMPINDTATPDWVPPWFAMEIELATNPGELFDTPMLAIGGDIPSLYAYIEAGVRLGRFDHLIATLQRIGEAGGTYTDFSRIRSIELEIDHALLTDLTMEASIGDRLKQIASESTSHQYVQLVSHYLEVAQGNKTLWEVIESVNNDRDRFWLARKRVTLTTASPRITTSTIGSVGELRFREGGILTVTGPLHLGRQHQPELFGNRGSASRNHAELRVRIDGRVELIDTHSKNGTTVDQHSLVPGKPKTLTGGEAIAFTDVHCVYHRS